MKILVTGGAGYIGTHTCVELLNAGYEVVVVDNLYNSSELALKRVEEIAGRTLTFYKADITNKDEMRMIFEKEKIDAVIHFAGLKAVGESVAKPLEYYSVNIAGTLILLEEMKRAGVKNIIFLPRRPFTDRLLKCRSRKNVRKARARIRTAGPNG